MSAVSFASAGYACQQGGGASQVVVVQEGDLLAGVIADDEIVAGVVGVEGAIFGLVADCQEGNMQAQLTLKRGDRRNIPFVVLTDPVLEPTLTWTWNGTLTVDASAAPTGVSVGDWVRQPTQKSGQQVYPFFKVTAVNAGDITIENPYNFELPTGSGLEVSGVVDITNSVTKFTMRLGDDIVMQKFSYSTREIEHTDPTAGELVVKLDKQDFRDARGAWLENRDDYTIDLENTRRGTLIGTAGDFDVSADGDLIVTMDTPADVPLLRVGDLVVPSGVSGNDVDFTVQENPTTDSDLAADQISTDYTGLKAETGVTFAAYEGNTKTPVCGTASIVLDATP